MSNTLVSLQDTIVNATQWAEEELVGIRDVHDPRYCWDVILLSYVYLDAQAMCGQDEYTRYPSEMYPVSPRLWGHYTSYSWLI